MKKIVQFILFYLIIFGIIGYVLIQRSNQQSEDSLKNFSINETTSIVSQVLTNMKKTFLEGIKKLSQKKIVDRETLLNLAPKMCRFREGFRCEQFAFDPNSSSFVFTFTSLSTRTVRVTGIELTDGIECKTTLNKKLDLQEQFHATLTNCSVYEEHATVIIDYVKENIGSDIKHEVRGLITLGSIE